MEGAELLFGLLLGFALSIIIFLITGPVPRPYLVAAGVAEYYGDDNSVKRFRFIKCEEEGE